jgi:multidrug efflux system outer membrane protein
MTKRFYPLWPICVLSLFGLSACTLGPDYERPKLDLPNQYNADVPQSPVAAAEVKKTVPIQQEWWTLFNDPELNKLEALALANNADLQIAVARIAQAQGMALQAGSAQYPNLSLAGSGTRASQGAAASPSGVDYLDNNYQGNLGFSYEIDLWGKVRRTVESADAQLKASVFDRDSVRLILEGSVAKAYMNLRALDAQIKVTESSIQTRRDTLRIARAKLDGGLVSPLDINQAQATLSSVQAVQSELIRQRAVAQNQLAVLTGKLDLKIPAGGLETLPIPPEPPVGMPSEILEARPDIRKAEEQLVAANAQIGVAKANFFPSFSLSGLYGAQSIGMTNFLSAGGSVWAATIGAMQPIFTGWLLTGQLDAAKGKQQEALANYVKTVRTAFAEVGDSMISVQQTRESGEHLSVQVASASKAQQISILRYQGGYVDYLTVLEAQRVANDASLAYARNRGNQLQASVDLFRALGGGWQPEFKR